MVPLAAYITIFLAVITIANVCHVRVYGYIEYYMSFVKCFAVIIMIFFLSIMTSGGIPATGGPIEFHYWRNPGAFNNGIKGIAKAFVQAAFSFGGGTSWWTFYSSEVCLTGPSARNVKEPRLLIALSRLVCTFGVSRVAF